MKEMARHVPEAASYAPITLLVDERSEGVYLSYDKMVSFLAPYGNAKALAVARDLDEKVEKLMRDAAGASAARRNRLRQMPRRVDRRTHPICRIRAPT